MRSDVSIGGLSGNNGSASSHSKSNHIGIATDDNNGNSTVWNNENDSSGTNIGKKTKRLLTGRRPIPQLFSFWKFVTLFTECESSLNHQRRIPLVRNDPRGYNMFRLQR